MHCRLHDLREFDVDSILKAMIEAADKPPIRCQHIIRGPSYDTLNQCAAAPAGAGRLSWGKDGDVFNAIAHERHSAIAKSGTHQASFLPSDDRPIMCVEQLDVTVFKL